MSRREFWKLLSEFLQQGLTIVMATPYLDEAERCSRVALLSAGRLLALDDPDALRASYPGEVVEVIGFPFDRAVGAVSLLGDVAQSQTFGERMHVQLSDLHGEAAGSRLAGALADAGCSDIQVRVVRPSLEDVFIDLLARQGNTV